RLPFLNQPPAGRNRGFGPIFAHIWDMHQPMVMASKPVQRPSARSPNPNLRHLAARAERSRVPTEGLNQMSQPVLALPVIRVDNLFFCDLERQASILSEVGR